MSMTDGHYHHSLSGHPMWFHLLLLYPELYLSFMRKQKLREVKRFVQVHKDRT